MSSVDTVHKKAVKGLRNCYIREAFGARSKTAKWCENSIAGNSSVWAVVKKSNVLWRNGCSSWIFMVRSVFEEAQEAVFVGKRISSYSIFLLSFSILYLLSIEGLPSKNSLFVLYVLSKSLIARIC